MTNPHRIDSVDALREVVGAELPILKLKVESQLDAQSRAFIAKAPFLVLATSDESGRLDTSPKGDAPGFVHIEDDQTLVIPDRPGNRLVYGHLNILRNPHVGMLFIVPNTSETLRVNGRAELTRDPALLERLAARGKPAVLAIRVRIEECFFHCGKAFIRSALWQPEQWPAADRVTFGAMYARKLGQGEETAQAVDAAVSADYRDNL